MHLYPEERGQHAGRASTQKTTKDPEIKDSRTKKPLTRVSKPTPGVHGRGAWRGVGRKGWQRVGKGLAKGWHKVGTGLAQG